MAAGTLFYTNTLHEFHASKQATTHKAYKFALDSFKKVLDAHSATEAGINLTAEVCKSVIANGMTLGIPGASDLVNFAIGKVVDMGAESLLVKIRGTKAKFVKAEYEFNDSVGDAMAEAAHHIRMLAAADQALKSAVSDYIAAVEDKKSTPGRLYRKLKAVFYSFHAMIWAWNKAHRDAVAVIQAAKALESFVTESRDALAKQQDFLIKMGDTILKDSPGIAVIKAVK